jgi:glycosyltransferase involved in cell wall biosynthesis
MSARIIVYAPGVHQGGGAVLLSHLLASLAFCEANVLLMLDPRFPLTDASIPAHISVHFLFAGVFGRIKDEMSLWQIARQHDHVLCFSNLPPFFKLRATVSVYCQNRCILQPNQLKTLNRKFFVRFWVQNRLMYLFKKHANEYIVQTPSMRRLLLPLVSKLGITIRIQPFWGESVDYSRTVDKKKNNKADTVYDFIYPANEVPHKNHRNLVKAWILLAQDNYYPSLCLTLDQRSLLWQWIQQQVLDYRLKITNIGQIQNKQLQAIYDQSACLLYPSILESLGLPLLEARLKQLPILASELDYVRDIVDPEQTFDPFSPTSICRAVQRWSQQEEHHLSIVTAQSCLASIQYLQKDTGNLIMH